MRWAGGDAGAGGEAAGLGVARGVEEAEEGGEVGCSRVREGGLAWAMAQKGQVGGLWLSLVVEGGIGERGGVTFVVLAVGIWEVSVK